MFGGEIYQYVGDEIVVIWPIRRKNSNCIRSFFKMAEIIERKKIVTNQSMAWYQNLKQVFMQEQL
jgi:hypothetical protein